MARYARFQEYEHVRLKQDRPTVPDHPITQLDIPRAVTRNDAGIIVDVHDVEQPGYEVEFFDADGKTVDVLALGEGEIEPWAEDLELTSSD